MNAPFHAPGCIDATDPFRPLTKAEDIARTNVHYTLPARFFEVLTGGEWHVYSCNLWPSVGQVGPGGQTASQERKLDLFAEQLELSPGKRLLDVGAGWGGPLLYLCKRYGVRGRGLSLSPVQVEHARAWARRLGVDCQFELCHWQDYQPKEPLDAIMTDEVIVHFSRLGDFFKRAYAMLDDGGVMVNKELHHTHPAYAHAPSEAIRFIDDIYGNSGFYRSLADELTLTNEAGFCVEDVRQLDASNYVATATQWRNNLREAREELVELVGPEVYRNYMIYLSLVVSMFSTVGPAGAHKRMRIHLVKSRKLPAAIRSEWGIEAYLATRGAE